MYMWPWFGRKKGEFRALDKVLGLGGGLMHAFSSCNSSTRSWLAHGKPNGSFKYADILGLLGP